MINWKNVYWNEMVRLKDDISYAEEYVRIIGNIDNAVQIIIGLATSASIASWKIWQNYSVVWALILGICQVVIIVKPILNFNERIKACRVYIVEASKIFAKMEDEFYTIKEKEIDSDKINDEIKSFRKSIINCENKLLKDMEFINWNYIAKKSQKKTELYLNKYYDNVKES